MGFLPREVIINSGLRLFPYRRMVTTQVTPNYLRWRNSQHRPKQQPPQYRPRMGPSKRSPSMELPAPKRVKPRGSVALQLGGDDDENVAATAAAAAAAAAAATAAATATEEARAAAIAPIAETTDDLPDQLLVEIGRVHHHLVLAQYIIKHCCHVSRIPDLMMDSVGTREFHGSHHARLSM